MRIGLVVTGGVDRSGRERVIPALLWLIEALARQHELHVFALYHEDEPCTYPLLGATVHDLGTRRVVHGWRRLAQRQRLRSTLASLPRFDVLHAYWGVPAGWVATSVGRRLDLPVIVTANSGEFVADQRLAYGFQRRWIDRRLIRDTMRRAARVTVCTRHMQSLAAGLGFDATVIPIGVPARLFTDEGATPYGQQDEGPWRLLHLAHLNPVKDQATLLRAFANIRRSHDAHLDIAGGDTMNGRIQTLASDLGLSSHVTFHGLVPQETVRTLLSHAHLHVLSSRHEAAGVSVLEAAAARVATAGTQVGYVADWAPGAAVAVEPGDVGALSVAVSELLARPTRRRAVGEQAYARAHAFTMDDTVQAFDALYRGQ
ncbi:MAG TPA: glycosyltransferase family 4 protein [Vicinamibacterales bacterium]|nr:glycosyltransferase family 4 protein [Vicinamibacterales bacterium]